MPPHHSRPRAHTGKGLLPLVKCARARRARFPLSWREGERVTDCLLSRCPSPPPPSRGPCCSPLRRPPSHASRQAAAAVLPSPLLLLLAAEEAAKLSPADRVKTERGNEGRKKGGNERAAAAVEWRDRARTPAWKWDVILTQEARLL